MWEAVIVHTPRPGYSKLTYERALRAGKSNLDKFSISEM